MTVGVVGLGLIGGSLVKAYKAEGHELLVYNRTQSVADYACLAGDADQKLTKENISKCELIHLSLYPRASIKWLCENAEYISNNCLVIDHCGTKREICGELFPLAEKYGFTFVGGHPMAGTHYSGYKNSKVNMFSGAPMVIVPPVFDDIALFDRIKLALEPMKLGKIAISTAEEHDKMIAFTSQMAHIVSNAYIKSPAAQKHKGFSAGSFKDLTRVAWLNENMWTELFLENSDNLINELDLLINNLEKYKRALEQNDADTLCSLLKEGRVAKELSGK